MKRVKKFVGLFNDEAQSLIDLGFEELPTLEKFGVIFWKLLLSWRAGTS